MTRLAWYKVWYIQHLCGAWSNGVGEKRETDKEHDEDCVEDGFQLIRVKFDRVGEGSREALGLQNCSINGVQMDQNWN